MAETEAPPATVDDARAKAVRRASDVWRRQLVDLSGRNRLLYYRDQALGTLDLGANTAPADPAAVDQLLAGSLVTLTQLFASSEPSQADVLASRARRARAIAGKAGEMLEERGIRTLFLAVGMAHWTEQQSAAQPAAPIVLFPITLTPRGASAEEFELQTVGDPQVSPTLLEKLATDFGLRINGAELDELLIADAQSTTGESITEGWPISAVLERLEKEADGAVPGFSISERLVIANFSYHKLPMVKDLEACESQLIDHDLVAAIAGDESARVAVASRDGVIDIDPALPDRQPPADEVLVVDADGTQSYAINAVLAGSNLVVKGPPGTGKSQTIANLIATLAAHRQRVLFVAEKRAAIDAVLKRLQAEDLGHLVMDLHHRAQSRRLIAQDLQAALDASATAPLVDLAAQQAALVARRDRLNRYIETLHRIRGPWGESLFTILAELPGIDSAGRVDYRFPAAALNKLDQEHAALAAQALRDLVGLGGVIPAGQPWAGARLETTDEVRTALEALTRLRAELAGWRVAVTRVTTDVGLDGPTSIEHGQNLVALVASVQATLTVVNAELFTFDLDAMVATLNKPRFARIFSRDYRRTRKRVDALRHGGDMTAAQVLAMVAAARDQRTNWSSTSIDGGRPRAVEGVDELVLVTNGVRTALDQLAVSMPHILWPALDLDVLGAMLQASVDARDVAVRQPEVHRLVKLVGGLGLDDCYRACTAAGVPGPLVESAFRHCWLSSIYEHELIGEPELVSLQSEFHDEVVNEFRRADEAHIDSGAARVRRAVAEWIVETRDAFPEQSVLLAKEAGKARRHIALRRLFREAPEMLTALKPCWAMSPLEVSQLLPGDKQYFDVVVFDEASQVTPADAIPAILRGKRIVVAGDQQQLPPTAFFLGADEDPAPDDGYDDSASDPLLDPPLDSGTTGFESILDVLSAIIPARTLGWHYRSQDERLIAFSNVYFYDQSLLTFPGVHGDDCLHHVKVDAPRPGLDANESASGEVLAVVEAIFDHAATRPNESLGVIALGQVHAERIIESLRRARPAHPEFDGFFDGSFDGVTTRAGEPFFVKNLERVQGDERDAIILSIGYGRRNASGRLGYQFGPILTEKGERRLNVAITRARRRLTLVSTFGAEDMDPARSGSRGVELLRRYLQYVASGGGDLGSGPRENPKLNPFEVDVRDRLMAAGVPVIAQYGVSGYTIDFVAADRDQPGRFVLAIECDGASYHSQPTARDRDRLRQQQLERLGWRFHRIWSTDWFADSEREVDRVVDAYERSLAVPARPHVVAPSAAPARSSRGPRPAVDPGHPISDYSPDQLVALAIWIESDTLLRTEDELVDELMADLGFKRHGKRIDEKLRIAISRARARR